MSENIPQSLPATTEERNRQQQQDQQQDQQREEQEAQEQEAQEPKQLDDLHTEHGDTTIADQVVEKIAGIATREVSGVYAMGSAAGRALSNITSKITSSSSSRGNVSSGVSIEKGERQTAIDVSVVVDYGVSIVEVSDNIRQNVIDGVEHATGLEVVEVNVNVTDVHLPEEDSDDEGNQHDSNRDRQSERLA